MRIVLLGPQGAGKGTQAQRISHRTGAKHISTGDLVPDEIIIQMRKPYLEEADSWILDGFPRNESQAGALDEMLKEIQAELDKAVALEAPDEALIERLSGRRTSEAAGNIYHIVYDPPPENAQEDPGPFVQRKDDTEEAIRRRLKIYHEHPEPLKGYYAQRGILATVDATQGIAEVTEDIFRAARSRNRRGVEDHDESREEEKGG